MDKQETVALCMPVYDKVYPKAWAKQMELAMSLGRQLPPEALGIFYIHKMPQPHAHNFLFNHVLGTQEWPQYVRQFGKLQGCPDWILWVEDDAAPPTNGFELLRKQADPVERPVMHAVSFDRAKPYFPSIWRYTEDGQGIEPIHDWEGNKLYRLAHSGTCFCLIHTSVFYKMKRPWFRMQPPEPGVQSMLCCRSLSDRMHEAGIPIWGYTGCVATHLGEHEEVGPELSRAYYAAIQKRK